MALFVYSIGIDVSTSIVRFNPKRCKPCYATTEYDMEVPKEDTFLEAIVHHASYTVPLLIIFLFSLYTYIGCRYNVKVKGKEWVVTLVRIETFGSCFVAVFSQKKKEKRNGRQGGKRSGQARKALNRGKRESTRKPMVKNLRRQGSKFLAQMMRLK